MQYTYLLFGLLVRSNLSIPNLAPVNQSSNAPDVKVYLGVSPQKPTDDPPAERRTYVSSEVDAQNHPALEVWVASATGRLRLDYADGTQFWLNSNGKEIWACWPDSQTIEDAATYLVGPVMGLLLRLRGVNCLHGSAVAFGDAAVAFVGPAGSGKSTSAAAFARLDHAVISDDIVAIEERSGAFHVLPAYPFLCLLPSSLAMIEGNTDARPQFTPNWEKRFFNLAEPGLQFEQRRLPLRAIYLLSDSDSDEAFDITPVAAREAVVELVANSFATRAISQQSRAQEFPVFGRLISTIPIRRIAGHRRSRDLAQFCREIIRNFQQQTMQVSA